MSENEVSACDSERSSKHKLLQLLETSDMYDCTIRAGFVDSPDDYTVLYVNVF